MIPEMTSSSTNTAFPADESVVPAHKPNKAYYKSIKPAGLKQALTADEAAAQRKLQKRIREKRLKSSSTDKSDKAAKAVGVAGKPKVNTSSIYYPSKSTQPETPAEEPK
jgi:hypothetical protein